MRRGTAVLPAPENAVLAGIEQVWILLKATRGAGGLPLFRVFKDCALFREERRGYRFNSTKDRGDEGALKPVKREDHLMDAWRYAVAAGMKSPARARVRE